MAFFKKWLTTHCSASGRHATVEVVLFTPVSLTLHNAPLRQCLGYPYFFFFKSLRAVPFKLMAQVLIKSSEVSIHSCCEDCKSFPDPLR